MQPKYVHIMVSWTVDSSEGHVYNIANYYILCIEQKLQSIH